MDLFDNKPNELATEQPKEQWFQCYWRPAIAWSYLVICLFDFLFAPVLMPYIWKLTTMTPYPWDPLTLKNGGLYHLSMGAIVGVYTFGRTKEKIDENKSTTSSYEKSSTSSYTDTK